MGCSLDGEGEGEGVQNVEKKQAIRKLVVGVCVMEKKVSLPFCFLILFFVFFFFFFGSRIDDDDDDRRTHIPFFLSFVDVFCHPCVEELCFLCFFSSLSFFLFCFRFSSFNGAKKISMVL